jgi:hypothetical protein
MFTEGIVTHRTGLSKLLIAVLAVMLCSQVHARPPATDPWFYSDNRDPLFMAPDKFQHYYGSFGLAAIGARYTSRPVAAAGAFVAGLLWEIKDDQIGVGFSWKDLVADGLGSIAGAVGWSGPLCFSLTYNDAERTIMARATLKI